MQKKSQFIKCSDKVILDVWWYPDNEIYSNHIYYELYEFANSIKGPMFLINNKFSRLDDDYVEAVAIFKEHYNINCDISLTPYHISHEIQFASNTDLLKFKFYSNIECSNNG